MNLPIDDDGFLRQANLFSAGSPPAVSFPLMIAQQYAGESIKPGGRDYATFLGKKIPYANPDFKTIAIGSWGVEPAPSISAWKLLAGRVSPDALADKIVLIGQSSDAARDTHFTPLFRLQQAKMTFCGCAWAGTPGAGSRNSHFTGRARRSPRALRCTSTLGAPLRHC